MLFASVQVAPTLSGSTSIALILPSSMTIAVGSPLPTTTLFETSPDDKKTLADVFGKKKGILFGVPGAFTPTCDQTHLPGYLKDYEKSRWYAFVKKCSSPLPSKGACRCCSPACK
mmetsp:Transcript_28949/g.23951  ORF Transcript_28949/g.23951 Transcript_28949/m.23951 type:complete len:115 (-) Transcript_28949:23-367(-)